MKVVNRILKKEIGAVVPQLVLILFLMLALVGLDVIAPWPFKILIDNVLSENPIATTSGIPMLDIIFHSRSLLGFFAVLIYFLSTFLLAVVEYFRSESTKKVIKRLTANFSKSAFKSLQSLAIGFYNKQKVGDYIYRLSYDVSALGEFLEDGLLPLITSSLYLLLTVGIMLSIDTTLTLFALVALPFLVIGLYSFNTAIGKATKRSEFFNSAAFSFIEEALSHLKIVQAFSQERRQAHQFGEKIDTSLVNDTSLYTLDFLLSLLVGIIISISYSIIILYGIKSVFAGTLTTGLLIVFIFYLDNLTNPVLNLIYASTAARQAYIKIRRMEEFFTVKSQLNYHVGGLEAVDDTAIRFENVTVRGDKGVKILEHVSFTVESGKRTVIFGVNGSGKTSVVNLILRFIDKPTSGTVYLGGHDIQTYDLKKLREIISYVPQEITLFNESIRQNIAFGNPRAKLEEVRAAAVVAAADEFIQKKSTRRRFF